jgi:hypothetical protein
MEPQKRRPGRPATGMDPGVNIRISLDTQAAIRDWADRNDVSSLSEAVRLFIEQGLKRDLPKSKRRAQAKLAEGI